MDLQQPQTRGVVAVAVITLQGVVAEQQAALAAPAS
jgi:hypothetical protein